MCPEPGHIEFRRRWIASRQARPFLEKAAALGERRTAGEWKPIEGGTIPRTFRRQRLDERSRRAG
jgi:hypothetical protein